MKKRGIEDMDLVMVDPWLATKSRLLDSHVTII
jgi:Cu2+-containing amine oxidase